MVKRTIIILTVLLTFISLPSYAWNLQLGVHHLMPKLWTGEQTYEDRSGNKLKFKPVIDKTIVGQTASIGFFYENVLFNYEQGQYGYDTQIPATNSAVADATDAEIEIREQRLGASYHLERELAGLYAGIGMTREQETVSTRQNKWRFEKTVPFFKFGIDLIFGSWRIRIEQIHFSYGEHSAKINSAGILFYL